MNPHKLAKSNTEHAHQRAFFAWVNMASRYGFDAALAMEAYTNPAYHKDLADAEPYLALFHAIPNGGKRDKREAAKLKAEGVKAGVLDTFLPAASTFRFTYPDDPAQIQYEGVYHGLYIEFKAPDKKNTKDGGLSQHQIEFMDAARHAGYCCRVAYSWAEAANLVMLYMNTPQRFTGFDYGKK